MASHSSEKGAYHTRVGCMVLADGPSYTAPPLPKERCTPRAEASTGARVASVWDGLV